MAAAPDTALELLSLVREVGIARLCKTYRKPPLPTRLLRDLYALEVEGTVHGHRFLAAYPLSPSDLLESLAQRSDDPETLASAALNPRIPPHVLARLAASELIEVRIQVASNPQLAPRDLRVLARDIEPSVRAATARNPSLKPQLMAEFLGDREAAVRAAVARRDDLFQEARYALTTDPSPIVRAALLENTDDPELLLFWAEREDADEQMALLAKRELPEDVLDTLLLSPHARVRAAVRERHRLSPVAQLALARAGTLDERAELAAESTLEKPLQRLLADDATPEVRSALAARADLDPDLAAHFVTMHDEAACVALAANPGVSTSLLSSLALGAIEAIPALLAYRADLPGSVATTLLESTHRETFVRHLASADAPPSELPADALAAFAEHPLPTVRGFVARYAALTSEARATLFDDPVPSVREAIIANPGVTDLELEQLLDDPDETVAQLATQRWRSNRRAHSTPQTDQPEPTEAHAETPLPEVDATPEGNDSGGVIRRLKGFFS